MIHIPETEEEYDNLTEQEKCELQEYWEDDYHTGKMMKHSIININE